MILTVIRGVADIARLTARLNANIAEHTPLPNFFLIIAAVSMSFADGLDIAADIINPWSNDLSNEDVIALFTEEKL